MSRTHVVFTCAHANPEVPNDRFAWLGSFLYDLKPDAVCDLGDFDDMPSLNSYDTRYPQLVVSQNYQKDIEHGQDARERLWAKFRRNKKGIPYRIGFEGNHEHRIKKAIAHDPRLEGSTYGISFSHLQTGYHYDEYHEYHNSGPAVAVVDGIAYAHYFSAGNFGKPLSGTHHAYSILQHRHMSSTCGHSHKRSVYFKDGANGKGIITLVAGSYKGADERWAGKSNSDWWKGIIVKREVEKGYYDVQFVSQDWLRKTYG